jgi:hypothetical protein
MGSLKYQAKERERENPLIIRERGTPGSVTFGA